MQDVTTQQQLTCPWSPTDSSEENYSSVTAKDITLRLTGVHLLEERSVFSSLS